MTLSVFWENLNVYIMFCHYIYIYTSTYNLKSCFIKNRVECDIILGKTENGFCREVQSTEGYINSHSVVALFLGIYPSLKVVVLL